MACGIPASAFKTIAVDLFRACNSTRWLTLENKRLIVDLATPRLQFSQADDTTAYDAPTLVVPLRPIVEDLRNALLAASEPNNQEVLRFPPTELPRKVKLAPERGAS